MTIKICCYNQKQKYGITNIK
uniref:Uncharacterized protein n=1 Tax=Rhizophora mucronata TaxID=61149 RepID=A0A2P2QC93_RHIMU